MASRNMSKEDAERLKSLEAKMDSAQRCVKESYVAMGDFSLAIINQMREVREEAAKAKAMLETVKKDQDQVKKDKESLMKERKMLAIQKLQVEEKEQELQKQENLQKMNEQQWSKHQKDSNSRLQDREKRIVQDEQATEAARRKLETDRKNLEDTERKSKMQLKLREEEVSEREELAARREQELTANENRWAQLKNQFEIAERNMNEAKIKQGEIARREKELNELEVQLTQSKADLDRRDIELMEERARVQDLNDHLQLQLYESNKPEQSSQGREVGANFNESNRISEQWLPVAEFLQKVEALEHLDPDTKLVLQNLVGLLEKGDNPTVAFMRCPKMSFEIGVGRRGGSVDTFACGRGDRRNDAVKSLVSDMKKKIKEYLQAKTNRAPSVASRMGPVA